MQLTINDISPVCGNYYLGDALFLQGYNLLAKGGLCGKRILEVGCGSGRLAAWLGRISNTEVVAIDISAERVSMASGKYHTLGNVTFLRADASDLSDFPANTFDIIVGQAIMHHLSNNLPGASQEYSRVLKPGGKCLFIFEPLGHNSLIAAIRAVNASRLELIDESNLYESTLKSFAVNFTRYEIYYFHLLAYGCKLFPQRLKLSTWIYNLCNRFDQALFISAPWTRKYAANFNVCYWK